MSVLLCFDHGSKTTGWGAVKWHQGEPKFLGGGVIDLSKQEFPLTHLSLQMKLILDSFVPDAILLEEQSSLRNANTVRKLLWSQGVTILAVESLNIEVEHLHRASVQKIVGGRGGCSKEDIALAVMDKLKLGKLPPEDMADALALGLAYPTWKEEAPKREAERRARRKRRRGKRAREAEKQQRESES